MSNLNFGQAIEALKEGKKVARNGWNGKSMHLWINKGSIAFDAVHGESNIKKLNYGVSGSLFEDGDTGTVTRMPNVNMRAANGETVTGWLASQTDMLAEDWCIVE